MRRGSSPPSLFSFDSVLQITYNLLSKKEGIIVEYKKIENELHELFCQRHNLKPILHETEIVRDISTRLQELFPGRGKGGLNMDMFGLLALPDKSGDPPYILIKEEVMEENYHDKHQYVDTCIHEIVHLYDWNWFARKYCNGDFSYSAIRNSSLYGEFYVWTEYNASRAGRKYYHESLCWHYIINGPLMSENTKVEYAKSQLSKVMEERYLSEINRLNEIIQSGKDGKIEYPILSHNVMKFVGLLLALSEVMPEVFNEYRYQCDLKMNGLSYEYETYQFLKKENKFNASIGRGLDFRVNYSCSKIHDWKRPILN